MRIALTGGTGFIGRYIIRQLAADGHQLVCWHRQDSDRSGFEDCDSAIEWREGELGNVDDAHALIAGCDALVHAALYHPEGGFMGGEGDLLAFAQRNVMGSLQLFEAAANADLQRVVFLSTCAVHDRILDDRPLDETHPLWPFSHYGRTRRPWRSSSTAMDWGGACRSVRCDRPACTASVTRRSTASGMS